MEALFGFTGSFDEKRFTQMSGQLLHRGSSHPESLSAEGFHAYYFDNYSSSHLDQKLKAKGSIQIGFAGTLFDEESKVLSVSALIERYQRQGMAFLKSLRGFYVIVLNVDGSTFLIRDGSGRRTLYYVLIEHELHFAVEPKALHTLSQFQKTLRPASVAQYLSFSYVPGEATMLEGLREVPAGSWVEFKNGTLKGPYRFFEFEREAQPQIENLQEAAKEFEQIFDDAIQELLALSPTPAVFLSGGLDSSMVTAKLAQRSSNTVHSFALHFGEEYPNELEFARAVAERCGTRHREIRITPKDFIPNLRRAIWHLDDPIGDPVTLPNFELAAVVAKEFEYVFNGEGGDPCFGGPKNLSMMLAHWYGGVNRGPYFREKQYLASYQRGYEDLEFMLTPDILKEIDKEEHLYKILTPYFNCQTPRSFIDKLMALNIRTKGAHLILPKVEKMLGAWNLVPLSPLFDERLVRFSFRIPGIFKVHRGIEKIVMKEACQSWLPKAVIARPKSGMRVPVHFWFQKEMRGYAKRLLSKRSIERTGIFRWNRVKQLLDYDIEEGSGRYGLRLWMLMTFEIWRRLVIEGEPV